MSLADESQISVSRVSKTAWGAALHAWRPGNWSQLSELQRLACRAAGTLDQDGCPQGIWHRALELSTRATSRTVLMARNGQVGFLSIVDRSVGDLLTVTSRVLLDDTTDTVTALESSLEVALAPRSQAWPLLRRVMPPDTRFRSPPLQGPHASTPSPAQRLRRGPPTQRTATGSPDLPDAFQRTHTVLSSSPRPSPAKALCGTAGGSTRVA